MDQGIDFERLFYALYIAGHLRHILKMTLASLLAHGAIMGMACHQAFDYVGSKDLAPSSSIEIIAPSVAGVMHAITNVPSLSSASRYCITAH